MNVTVHPLRRLYHCPQVDELVALDGVTKVAASGQFKEVHHIPERCSHAEECGLAQRLAQHVPLVHTDCRYVAGQQDSCLVK